MERPEMESGLRWRVSERETRSEMESEPERDAVCDGVQGRNPAVPCPCVFILDRPTWAVVQGRVSTLPRSEYPRRLTVDLLSGSKHVEVFLCNLWWNRYQGNFIILRSYPLNRTISQKLNTMLIGRSGSWLSAQLQDSVLAMSSSTDDDGVRWSAIRDEGTGSTK
uniref:Uncharacterized protein n=1 Tax=Fagus sylvatica TaxID=28930 RepID=A0A2N9HXW3_FAGSY